MRPLPSLTPPQRVYSAFALYAMAIGGIFPRLVELQRTLGIDERTLGLALIGTATGTLVSLTMASRWLPRLGHRRALRWLIPAIAAVYAAASWAPGAWALYALLVPAGLCIGAVEIVVNLEADRIEHQVGRRIMSRAHAFWSIGFFAAGLIGAALAQLGVGVQAHLAGMVVLITGLTTLLLAGFEPAVQRPDSQPGVAPRWARPTRTTLMLVAATLAAMVLEGAGAEWSAIYMRDVFGAPPFIAELAVALGAGAQALARWWAGHCLGHPLVLRHRAAPGAAGLVGRARCNLGAEPA